MFTKDGLSAGLATSTVGAPEPCHWEETKELSVFRNKSKKSVPVKSEPGQVERGRSRFRVMWHETQLDLGGPPGCLGGGVPITVN